MNAYSGQIAALAAALGWTVSAVCWTAAGKSVGSLVVNTVRLVIAFILFLIYGALFHGEAIPLSASQYAWFWLGLSGVVGYFLCDLCLFRSFLMMGPRLGLLIFSMSPIVASLCGWWWLDERLVARDILGIAVALSGVTWVVLESPTKKTPAAGEHHFSWLGALFAFLAMVCQGVAAVISKIGLRHFDSPIAATQIRVVAGLICFIVLMGALRKLKPCLDVFRHGKLMLIMTTGSIAGPAAGVALLLYALTKIQTGLAMTFMSLTPVMVIPFSVLIFKERVSPRAICGAVVAVVGLSLLLQL